MVTSGIMDQKIEKNIKNVGNIYHALMSRKRKISLFSEGVVTSVLPTNTHRFPRRGDYRF